jgi:hypothetical protein
MATVMNTYVMRGLDAPLTYEKRGGFMANCTKQEGRHTKRVLLALPINPWDRVIVPTTSRFQLHSLIRRGIRCPNPAVLGAH